MKQNNFSISSLLSLFTVSALTIGCASEFDHSTPAGEKPAAVTEAEQLASYNTLVSYVDAATFHLGNTLASDELDKRTVASSLTMSNFNEVFIPDLYVHNKQVDAEGNIDTLAAASLAKDVSAKGINIFAPALCASTNVNTAYLESLIAPITVEEEEVTGSDVTDFEADDLGKTYTLQKATGEEGKGTAVVENDPAGQSGHAVHVTKTNQSFPAITIKFPNGRKLGDYTDLVFDFYAKNATALNQKIFCGLGGKNAEFKSANEYGCKLNTWGRGQINIPLAALAFSDDQKMQTEVTLVIGPKLLNCDYFIDNISLVYKYRPTYEVEKTPEEKFMIIGGSLGEYIKAAMASAPAIKSWTVADCPVSSAADLIWKQTMGETYFAYAAQQMRQVRGDATLFVSEYLLDPEVRARFLHLLTANAVGMDQINGIDVMVSVAAPFDANAFAAMLRDVAATGRLVKLTIQDIAGSDVDAAAALLQAVAAYKQQVPAQQRYGISFGAVIETSTNAGLWTRDYNRKLTYASCAEALQM